MNFCQNCHSENVHDVLMTFVTTDPNDTEPEPEPILGSYCLDCEIFVKDNTA